MPPTFVADDAVREVAQAYALDAVDHALRNMKVELDWSEESIERVEKILDRLHSSAPTAKPTLETIEVFAKVYGSYIGEVFMRHHGGVWGMVTYGDDTFPGVRAAKDDHLFWPWIRVLNRLRAGPEENVWHYYLYLTDRLPGGAVRAPPL